MWVHTCDSKRNGKIKAGGSGGKKEEVKEEFRHCTRTYLILNLEEWYRPHWPGSEVLGNQTTPCKTPYGISFHNS